MRILYVVDIHDRFDAVPRALAEIGPVDVLVVGGDITTLGSPDDAEHAIDMISLAGEPNAFRLGFVVAGERAVRYL